MNNYIQHYASEYYDPDKAHEYYMKNRKLKGRQTSRLNEEGKEIWDVTKSNITESKNKTKKEAQSIREYEIEQARNQADELRSSLTEKFKMISEKLSEKYNEDREDLTDSQKEQLDVISRQRDDKKEKVIEDKKRKLEMLSADDSLSSDEKKEIRQMINEQSRSDVDSINADYKQKAVEIRTEVSDDRKELSNNKKKESEDNSKQSKEEREKIATELKNVISSARKRFEDAISAINSEFENTYQTEYDKISSQYSKPVKQKKPKNNKSNKSKQPIKQSKPNQQVKNTNKSTITKKSSVNKAPNKSYVSKQNSDIKKGIVRKRYNPDY